MYYLTIKPDYKVFYKNRKLHRIRDLPAIEYVNGEKRWYKNHLRHRDNNLPAVEFANGHKEWWEKDVRYYFANGTKEFRDFFHKQLHRHNGPAGEYSNGALEYWICGERHRTDGPAVIYGDKQYFFERGEFIKCIL